MMSLPATSRWKGLPQDPRPACLGLSSDQPPHPLSFPAGQARWRREPEGVLTSRLEEMETGPISPSQTRHLNSPGAAALPGGPRPSPPPRPRPGFEERSFTNFSIFLLEACLFFSVTSLCFMSFRADLHVLPSV